MLECALLRPKPRGFSREPCQDYRNHDHRNPQYSVLRPFFRLAGRLILPSTALLSLLICLFIAPIIAPRPAFAQQTDEDEVVRVNTDLLLFPVRIRDKKGQAVTGLSDRDLVLKDQDKVTTGVYFSPGADRVALMFALDQSGSLRQVISQQQEAALALFSRFGERSSVAILRFSDTASLVAPFTKDLSAARAAFRFVAAPNEQTAIFDAAAKAVKAFDALPPVRAERRIIILISDGLDTRSRTSADSVIDAALDRRVSFYVIHLPLFEPRNGHLAVRPPSKGFRDLAEKTGGKYFLVGDVKSALNPTPPDLGPIFQVIEE